MKIKFDPNNIVIKLCMMGMDLEDSGKPEEELLHDGLGPARDAHGCASL